MDSKITFTLHADGKSTEKTIVYNQLLAIGYAGRNIAKTMEHIKELEEQLGVPAPKKIPTIFQMSNMLLTQDPDIDFVGNNTCGEVGTSSSRRAMRSTSASAATTPTASSRAPAFPRPSRSAPSPSATTFGSTMISRITGIPSSSIPIRRWTARRSPISRVLADILPVEHLLKELRERIGDVSHCVIYSGTVPVLNGFQYGENFRCEMIDETLNRSLSMNYNIHVITRGGKMKMKKLITLLLALAMVLSLAACGSKDTPHRTARIPPAATYKIKLGTTGNEEHQSTIAANFFKEKVEELTNGAVTVEIYPNSQLGSEREMAEGVKLGTLEMTIVTTDGTLPAWVPETQVLSIPYLLTSKEVAYEVLDNTLQPYFAPLFEAQGL